MSSPSHWGGGGGLVKVQGSIPRGPEGSTALAHTSRSYQRAFCQEGPPRDHSLCWPSRDGVSPPPCRVPGHSHPNAPSPSPVPSSLRSAGKCVLYCNGVLEPLYLCPNGARCATWFQDPPRFTGTLVSCALSWVSRFSQGLSIGHGADPGKNEWCQASRGGPFSLGRASLRR